MSKQIKTTFEVGRLIAGDFRRHLKRTNHINKEENLHVNYTEDKGFITTTFYLTITGQEFVVDKYFKALMEVSDQ